MKQIIFLTFIILTTVMNAQNHSSFPYEQKWNDVDSAIEQGANKSLLPKVDTIYQHAKADNNKPEIVKSLLYRAQILSQTQEDEEDDVYKLAILDFEKEIPQFEGVTKSVLQSLLANIYYQYMQNTQWKRQNITELDSLPKDIAEWPSKQLLLKSIELYDASLKTEEIRSMLKQEKTENWKQLLTAAEDIDLYPALYDVLATRELNFIQRGNFILLNDEMREKGKNLATQIIADLIDFHKDDRDKSAFLNYKLIEIENQTFDNQNDEAEQILALAEQYQSEPFSAYLYYRAAQIYNGNGDKIRAYDICKNVPYNPSNKWTENAKSLMAQLQIPAVRANIDEVCLPDEPIAVTVSATNVNKIFYRIYENKQSLPTGGFQELREDKGKLLKSGAWDLKQFDDFQEHSTIVALDGLPQGNYFIEISNNQNFNRQEDLSNTNDITDEMKFAVSDWTLVRLNTADFQLVNRKTGQPIANETLTLILESKDRGSVTTSEKGMFQLGSNVNYIYNSNAQTYFPISIPRYYNSYGDDDDYREAKVDFFLDRSIYRPGQTVYFKGIAYSKLKNEAKIIKNKTVTVELLDDNDQKISELTLTTNDFGSIFGEFVLPTGGLTGNYYIRSVSPSPYGSIGFQVEEYKRPKFEVVMDSLKGEYVLEQEVHSSGKAESYAGAAISDAKVVYRVERQEIFPYYRWWYPPRNSDNETIVQGETQTDDAGKFEISFIAKPKNEKKKGEYRTYTCLITADVTDINGETHTATQRISIGDLPKYLTMEMPDKALQKNFSNIAVKSTNLNGVTEPSKGQVIITQLIAPSRILLPNKISGAPQRYYNNYYSSDIPPQITDYQIIPKEKFIKLFPHLPYSADETQPDKWKKGKVFTYNFDTQKSENVKINRLEKGFYIVEACTMFGSDSIKTARIVEIQDDKTLKSTDNTFFAVNTNHSFYQVGDEIKITLRSDLQNTTAILNISNSQKWLEQKIIPIINGTADYTLIATDNHIKDGLYVSAYLMNENGYETYNFPIQVQSKPMNLNIATKTFRDKIKPGEPETWELTVSGEDKDQFTAEVLATMYDASLDAFAYNSFSFNPFYYYAYGYLYQNIGIYGYRLQSCNMQIWKPLIFNEPIEVNFRDFSPYGGLYRLSNFYSNRASADDALKVRETDDAADFSANKSLAEVAVVAYAAKKSASTSGSVAKYKLQGSDDDAKDENSAEAAFLNMAQIRTNLQETAFFYPNLYTDADGNVKFSFTSPEALTKWKLLVLAHTQDLHSGTAAFSTQTQKELMVAPNVPRFLREGDEVVISAKINNLSNENLSGLVKLYVTDALTGLPLPQFMADANFVNEFSAEKGKNTETSFRFDVPKSVQAINYEIVAATDDEKFSDGESSILPVLPNRMMVTETMPIFAKEGQTKTFKFDKLVNNSSNSLQNFNLTFEITTNPLWLAVMSLPYLREYPYECSEQIFSRLYGNILSTCILNSNPKIKRVFDNWNTAGINVSKLEQNEELKNILLEETPWVREAQDENEQRKRIALFFDLNKMSQELYAAQQKLVQRQNADGGFPWFDGGKSSAYITEHIVQGFGQLKKMLNDSKNDYLIQNLNNLIENAIKYVDSEQVKEIKSAEQNAKKYGGKIDGKDFIHYYYVRSFWKEKYPLPAEAKKYLDDINKNISDYFREYDLQRKAMIATVLYRYGYSNSAKMIINNLAETSVEADEMGMYWKDNRAGWLWYQSPVEAQAKAIEAFVEVSPEKTAQIEEMKVWLLKNRQTNAWNSTKATTDAVYALISFGKDWTNSEYATNVWVGNEQVYNSNPIVGNDVGACDEKPILPPVEQQAGYFKTSWLGNEITPEMGIVKIEKTSPGIMWGGMYWQYFEDLDKITQADSNVKMEKSLLLKKNTDSGQKLIEITDNSPVTIGDLVTVRLVIHVDRDMEYIHIKDMRAAGFEPVNVLSSYKYQNGCGYCESTRDAATNFFFERMTKGTYVFEYDVRANNAGTFSNGITTLQNMYAPEMSCHSEGMKVQIEN